MHLGGFFPPSATAAAVPLWRFNYLHNYKGPKFFLWPSFFAQISRTSLWLQYFLPRGIEIIAGLSHIQFS
jgi:hypothetical protein